jgi:hypothetical protein
MINGSKIGIVTGVMNRLIYLSQSLPTWVKLKEIDKIVIVDWNSEEDIIPLINSINDSRVYVARIPNQQYWDPGRVFNIGTRFSDTDFVFITGCDIKINYPCFDSIKPLPSKEFYIRSDKWKGAPHKLRGLYGTCIFQKKMWMETGGYIEEKKSYGLEDSNFFTRAQEFGYTQIKCLTANQITHISHGYDIRQKYYKEKYDNIQDAVRLSEQQLNEIGKHRGMKIMHGLVYHNGAWSNIQPI